MRYLILILSLFVILTSCSTESTPVYTLSTNVNVPEAGTVNPSSGEFDEGTNIEITATPNEDWIFESWSGGYTGSGNPGALTMNQDIQVTAMFIKLKYSLNKEVEGEGIIDERVVQQKTTEYESGTVVELTAKPADGWRFSHWENDVEGEESPITIEMDGEKYVKAVFEEKQPELKIFTEGSGVVETVLLSGSEAENGQFEYNSVVELTAKPADGWRFSHWEEDVTGGDSKVEVTMDDDKVIVAIFRSDENNEINLAIGESYTHEFPGESVTLPDQMDAVYRIGVIARDYQKNGSTVLSIPDDLMLKTRQIGGSIAKSLVLGNAHSDQYDRFDDDMWELKQKTHQVHKNLRNAEQRGGIVGRHYTTYGEPSRLSPQRPKWNSESEPEESRTFFADNPDGGERIEVETTLRKNGTNIIYYQDNSVAGTPEEATDQEIEDLLKYYDQHGKPVIDEMFGGLGPEGTTNHFRGGERTANDIDGNGKFIVLQLHPDNMIGGAAGYVSSCDRDPLEENYNAGGYYCERSNEAEITYLLRPDSDYYLATLVHEAKHISSHGYATFGDRNFQPAWVEEGTAEIAGEMSSRRAAGFTDDHRVTYNDIYPGGTTTSATYGMSDVHSSSRMFLNASPKSGIIGDPEENPNNSTFYGSGWLFHRYLADNYANNQNQFFRDLNNGTYEADISGLTSITGKDFNELLSEFMIAIQIEGKVDAMNNSSISFASYDFEDITSNFSMGDWPFLNKKSEYSTGDLVLSPIYYTSPVFFEFTAPGGSTLELELLNGNGESLNTGHDGALIITRIE